MNITKTIDNVLFINSSNTFTLIYFTNNNSNEHLPLCRKFQTSPIGTSGLPQKQLYLNQSYFLELKKEHLQALQMSKAPSKQNKCDEFHWSIIRIFILHLILSWLQEISRDPLHLQ